MLEIRNIEASYNKKPVLNGVSLGMKKGEVVALIGPNGAGKSTLLKTIIGIIKPSRGEIIFNGKRLDGSSPTENIRKGIVYVPQGNTVFNDLTVFENLQMGAYTVSDKSIIEGRINDVFILFPEIKERKHLDAGDLSGGEKQMLALGRALMLKPELLLLDEPSLGLSPKALRTTFETIKGIVKSFNASILIVEQNVREVMEISDSVCVMVMGKIVVHDVPANLTKERIKEMFLGGVKI